MDLGLAGKTVIAAAALRALGAASARLLTAAVRLTRSREARKPP